MPEPVLIVEDWWDGPRAGVALYDGHPHYFERLFDDALDDFTDRYRLTPIDADALHFFTEHAAIFQRWSNAFQRGETDMSTHPALPIEAERSKALGAEMETVLGRAQSAQFEVTGRFSSVSQVPGRVEYPETNLQFSWSSD